VAANSLSVFLYICDRDLLPISMKMLRVARHTVIFVSFLDLCWRLLEVACCFSCLKKYFLIVFSFLKNQKIFYLKKKKKTENIINLYC
jgi:hypothetical protein